MNFFLQKVGYLSSLPSYLRAEQRRSTNLHKIQIIEQLKILDPSLDESILASLKLRLLQNIQERLGDYPKRRFLICCESKNSESVLAIPFGELDSKNQQTKFQIGRGATSIFLRQLPKLPAEIPLFDEGDLIISKDYYQAATVTKVIPAGGSKKSPTGRYSCR